MKLLGNDVPPLGMGCWGIGGRFGPGDVLFGFPDIDEEISIRTLHAAFDGGVRVFDTAAVYGAGNSERLVGLALKGRPDAIVMTKFGMAFDEQTRQVLGDQTNAADISNSIEASLRRLQRDHIDVLLLHLNSLPVAKAAPIFEAMEKARIAGKLRAYGWSTDFPGSVKAMAAMPGFIGVEHAMNVFVDVPTIEKAIKQHDLIAFIRSPLAMGLLTGKFDGETRVPPNDVRSVNNDKRDYFHNGRAATKYLDQLQAVRDLLQTDGRTLAQVALGWLLAKSDRNIPLPGARNADQATENAAAIELGPLPATVMAEIEPIIERAPEGAPRVR